MVGGRRRAVFVFARRDSLLAVFGKDDVAVVAGFT
jgi:hypothetical protein